MIEATTTGLVIAKHVLQIQGVFQSGAVVMRRRIRHKDVLSIVGEISLWLVDLPRSQ